MGFSYKQILDKAKECKKSVEKDYKLGINYKNAYYFAKLITNPKLKKVDWKKMEFAPKPNGNSFSRQIIKKEYIQLCNDLITFVEKKNRMPNFLKWQGKNLRVRDYTYLFARILIWYDEHKAYPNNANVNSKAFIKPSEPYDEVYNYFVKVFGKINCIDDALDKIAYKGYGYYYDDQYTNKQSIDRMKNGQGVNCTDSCHVFYNLGLHFVKTGKYKKVECIHVKCRGGDGHVRLRFTLPNNQIFYRDPACTLENGGYCNWCMDGNILAVNPNWFMENLNR